jgi:hypothetical protein
MHQVGRGVRCFIRALLRGLLEENVKLLLMKFW